MDEDPNQQQEALRLKSIAETQFRSSNLKSALKHAKKAHRLLPDLDGLSSMLTAFKILHVASMANSGLTDWYKILQVEPFSHINIIKIQYKKLALHLHPDKNPYLGCEEAFKLVSEGFRVLSDKIKRKEYDTRLRIRLQDEQVKDDSVVETFWTACSRCRLLHQFERKYLGQNLVCPSCKKSFEAVEVEGGDKEEDGGPVRVRSRKLGKDVFGGIDLGSKEKLGSVDLKRKVGGVDLGGKADSGKKTAGLRTKVGSNEMQDEMVTTVNLEENEGDAGKWGGGRLRTRYLRRKTSTVDEVLERSKLKVAKVGEEMMTIAELQLAAKEKASKKKAKLKEKQKDVGEKEKVNEKCVSFKRRRDSGIEKNEPSQKGRAMDPETRSLVKSQNMEVVRRNTSKKSTNLKSEMHTGSRRRDLERMAVDDLNFYDFDKDRVERSFKKGQVWAIYDDDEHDGMPRTYAVIDEVVSVYPFKVKLSWLDLQNSGDNGLICWEKVGFRASCGKFKVSQKMIVGSVDAFSHVVECERAAREVYRIYPKKGSVWALDNEAALGSEGTNLSARDKGSYDIVVCLTTYSEIHGLSVAYLEKVDGFKSVFKRREVGCHAIRWFQKDDVQLFSHQIPARKVYGDEVPELLKGCWELDPASLPSDLLTVGWGR